MKKKSVITTVGLKFMRFWIKRGSLIIKDYTKIVDDIYNINDNKNLFISINSYLKGVKERNETYVNNYNTFFFDVDLKDNGNMTKEEIKEKILEKESDFDFIIETKNGFHFYILIDNKKILTKDEYIKKWKEKFEYYENILSLNLDKNTIKVTQISRIPGTIHKKEGQEEFTIKLLKGESLLEDSIIDIINKVPIKEVIEKLNIKYDISDLCLYEGNRKTNGRKMNLQENYVNDFSGKCRPRGETFSFVKGYYTLRLGVEKKIYIYNLTYKFFQDNFGIISKVKKEKNIKINKFLDLNLSSSDLSQNNLIYFLYFQYYSTKNNLNDGERSQDITLKEFAKFIGNEKICKKTLLNNIKSLNENSIINTETREKKIIKNFKIIEIKIEKNKVIKFCILPQFSDLKDEIYSLKFYHFLSKNILDYKANNNLIIDFYFYIHKNLILKKEKSIFIKNDFLDFFKINKNLSLRNKFLKDFGDKLEIYEVKKVKNEGFDFINKKV